MKIKHIKDLKDLQNYHILQLIHLKIYLVHQLKLTDINDKHIQQVFLLKQNNHNNL